MLKNKEINCNACFKKIATLDRHLDVIEEDGATKINNTYPVGPNEVEEVRLTCSCGNVTTLYGG